MRLLMLAIFLWPAAAQAQNEPEFSIAATLACLDAAGDPAAEEACIGTSARACFETPGGYSTIGTSYCLDRERAYWDARLNDSYRALRAAERREDAEYGHLPGTVSLEAALRDMQRAWIPFRDATCEYERAQWGGGSGGGPAWVGCAMLMTAKQTLYIERATDGL